MLRPGQVHWLATLLLAAICFPLAGCGESKITRANYDKVTNGMMEEDVEAILGKGEEQAEINMQNMGVNLPNFGGSGVGRGMKVKTWQDGSKTINITFKDGKVLGKFASGL